MDEGFGSREGQGGAKSSDVAEVKEGCLGDVVDVGEK